MTRKKNQAAAALGKLGGLARAKNPTKAQRSEVAKKAARARWQNIAQPPKRKDSLTMIHDEKRVDAICRRIAAKLRILEQIESQADDNFGRNYNIPAIRSPISKRR